MTTATDHARSIFAWLEAVAADPELPATASRLAIVLTKYINRQTGDAWPSIPRLAGDLSTSENTIRAAMKALKDRAHLAVEIGGGRAATNRYRMIAQTGDDTGKPCNILKGKERKPLKNLKGKEQETLQHLSENPSTFEHKPFRKLNPNHIKNHCIEPSELIAREKPSNNGFEIFWQAWPNKVGKPAAQKAFARVWKELPDIIAGVERYVATKPPDRQWMNPATFLNQRRWEDDPAPVAAPATRAIAPRRNADGLDTYRRAGVDLSNFEIESQ